MHDQVQTSVHHTHFKAGNAGFLPLLLFFAFVFIETISRMIMRVDQVYENPAVEIFSMETEQPFLTGSGLEDINPDKPDEDWV